MKLKELRLTQDWLLKALRANGYKIAQPELSRFINGKKPSPKCDMILSAAWDILKLFEETEKLKRSN